MKNDSLLSKAKTWCRTLPVPYLIDFVELANKAKWTPLFYLSLAIAMTFHPELPVAILFLYFFVPVATILISLGLYKYLNKWLPSFTKAATGGR